MTTADLLTATEICERRGFYTRDWKQRRLHPTQILQKAICAGLVETERADFGNAAGERFMELAADPGMEVPATHYLHASVVHHAALADTLVSALRRAADPAWGIPAAASVHGAPWKPSAYLAPSGDKLRRVVLVSSWSDARHWSEIRSWYGLGEVAVYGLPMSMVVLVLGQHRDGRRSSPWTKGFLHPQNHRLRFRKKSKSTSEVFNDKWEQVWREDRGDIRTRDWLQAMLEDDVLRDVCFPVEIPVPGAVEVKRLRDMAKRKLERIGKLKQVPEPSLSVCDRPPCAFKSCCWSEPEYAPAERSGFVRIQGGNV